MTEPHVLIEDANRLIETGAIASKLASEFSVGVGACVLRAQLLKRLAERGNLSPQEIVDLADEMIGDLQPLMHRIEGWIAFARARTFVLEAVRLDEFLTAILPAWEANARAVGVTLRVQVDPDLPRVHMDVTKMRVVFAHLLMNALDARRNGTGTITIDAHNPGVGHVTVTVEDDGAGFDSSVEPFALFATSKPGAAGLGLAVAKEILHAHGGDIECERGASGGTRFVIDLPLRPSAVQR